MNERTPPGRAIWQDRYPLITTEIRKDLKEIRAASGTRELAKEHIGELLRRHPLHFDALVGDYSEPASSVANERAINTVLQYFSDSEEYLDDLMDLSSDEIILRYAVVHKAQREREKIIAKDLDKRRFFSYADAGLGQEERSFWLNMHSWTDEEAVALSLDRNPDRVSSRTIEACLASDFDKRSDFATTYNQRLRLLRRSAEGDSSRTHILPEQFISWLNQYHIIAPSWLSGNKVGEGHHALVAENERLLRQLDAHRHSIDDISPRLRKTLHLLLLVMAIEKYKYKLDGNSSAVSNIIASFHKIGLRISDKTVKGALDDAVKDPSLEESVQLVRTYHASR